MPHLFLQRTINPEAGEDEIILNSVSQSHFTAIAFDPWVQRPPLGKFRTPYQPVVFHRVHIRLFQVPLLLLNGGCGLEGLNESVHFRPLGSRAVPLVVRVIPACQGGRGINGARNGTGHAFIGTREEPLVIDAVVKDIDLDIDANRGPVGDSYFDIAQI